MENHSQSHSSQESEPDLPYRMLDRIKQPSDLKQLTTAELIQLASDVRRRIISVLSVNGGHLASNLGSVELTLALHTIFDSPEDKFIFDVSHQTYTHKLITGRNDARFEKIRKSKGLSGFAHPAESEHDHFFAGHAATALSLGLGMAKARDLAQENHHVIPIIGDATLTCGLALEALNNMCRSIKKFVVVLNDNAMSISRNVGGITHILSRLLSNPRTSRWVRELEMLVSKIPRCGSSLAKKGQKLSESVKNLVSPAPFFEHFGLSYIGPIDGHDIKKMITIFQSVKDLPMPVIIHLFTKKGNGLLKAENDPITYHGVKPFDPKTCEFLPSKSQAPTFPKIFGKHLLAMAEKDQTIVAITPAMSLGSCLDPFMEAYPDRCFDVGIAEGHAVTFAGGLAKSEKLKVVCSIYATFFQRAFDNLCEDVCLQRIPVVFAVDRSGLAAGDGATHHGIYDIGFLKTMPNMVICQPRNGHLLKELLESAFSWKCPVAIRYPNLETDEEKRPIRERPLGKSEILEKGDDLIIFALGHLCQIGEKVRKKLLDLGIAATLIDPIFIKPLDTELLGQLLIQHSRVVTIEEHSLKGGFGDEINAFIFAYGFTHVQVLNCGIPSVFYDHASYDDLLKDTGLSPDKILHKILTHFEFSKKLNLEKVDSMRKSL